MKADTKEKMFLSSVTDLKDPQGLHIRFKPNLVEVDSNYESGYRAMGASTVLPDCPDVSNSFASHQVWEALGENCGTQSQEGQKTALRRSLKAPGPVFPDHNIMSPG